MRIYPEEKLKKFAETYTALCKADDILIFKVLFEHMVFPRRNWEGEYEEPLFIPHGHKLGCSSLLTASGKWCCAPFTQGLWKLQHLTRMRACVCTFCPLLRNLTFLNWYQNLLQCHCFGLLPCFLGRSLEWLIAPEAGAETSMVVKSAVQPLSAEDQAHKQSIFLRGCKVTLPSSPKRSLG